MVRPVVIVSPVESGIELAPAFKTRGIPAIAVTLPLEDWVGFGMEIQASHFMEIIPYSADLVDILKKYDPIAVIPGSDEGVPLAEYLTNALTPHFANDSKKSLNRLHKALMQAALKEAGVAILKTLSTASENEVEKWILENELSNEPIIMKPPMSAGSDKVFHISPNEDWKHAFNRILAEPAKITGKMSETVVVQEQATGTEFAVGTVSANGKHYLAHLIQYNKTASGNRKTIFDHVEFVPHMKEVQGDLFDYVSQALDALGIRWGAAHTEIMLTSKGPRLIESGARMCGGPTVEFARIATGSSQADKIVEAYLDGDVQKKEFVFKKTVMPVFLKSPAEGKVLNTEVFDNARTLPTFLSEFLWFKNTGHVPHTVDYLTSIGIIALSGNRDDILLDYQKIREMESKLIVEKHKI